MAVRRIMAPVTFADDSLEAAEVAAQLAAALGAELVLVGIAPVSRPASPFELDDPADAARHDEQQTLLDRIVGERLREAAGAAPAAVPTRMMLVHGPVGLALLAAAQDDSVDAVVVPMRRHSEFGHLVHDHEDRYVLHHAGVPVLVVPIDDHSARDRLAREAA